MPPKQVKSNQSSDESMDMDDPTITDTREYSDFILFCSRTGRFQSNSLLDQERKMGVINLLKSERVIKLTTDRRATPVNIAFTPGGPRQRVYLVAIVRRSVPTEELDALIERMNGYIEGMTPQEKERTVRDLVYATGSRVIPGVRFLPLYWYEAGELVPPDQLLDEDGRKVDDGGLPVLDTDEEVVAVAASKAGGKKRDTRDQSMPSQAAILSDASTDSEVGPGTRRKKDKGKVALPTPPPPQFESQDEQTQETDDSSPPKKQRVDDRSVHNVEEHDQTEMKQEREERSASESTSVVVLDPSAGDRTSVESDKFSSVSNIITMDIPEDEMPITRGEFMKQMKEMQDLMQKSVREKNKKGNAARDGTPPMYNDAESKVLELFPINIYNEAIDWLLKQPVVQRLIYFDVIRLAYRNHPVFKPECDWVIARYMDYLLSQRLQTHFAKATKVKRKTDYSRVPMPKVIVDIADTHLVDLGKRRVPGSKDTADFMKGRCNTARRIHLLYSEHVLGAKSLQEMAFFIYAERVDFVAKHDWLTLNIVHDWTFEKEVAKTRKLLSAKNHKEDPTFDGNQPLPDDIESDIWPSMDKGTPLNSMEEAHQLVDYLEASGVSVPVLPPEVWALVRMRVEPNERDVALARRAALEKEATRQQRLSRRRKKYRSKKKAAAAAAAAPEDSESEDDDLDLSDDATDQGPKAANVPGTSAKKGNKDVRPNVAKATQETEVDQEPDHEDDQEEEQPSQGDESAGQSTRRDIIRNLMGNVSDISSSESGKSGKDDAQVQVTTDKDGAMVFTQTEPQGEEAASGQGQDDALATGQLLEKAKETGIANKEDSVMVACDKTATVTTKYSVVVQPSSDKEQEATVVSGEKQATHTTKETLTKPAEKKKTDMERYAAMEEDMISDTIMEGGSLTFSSTSSSSGSDKDQNTAKKGTRGPDPTIGKDKDIMPPPKDPLGNRPGRKLTTADWSVKPSTSKQFEDNDEDDFKKPDSKKARTRSETKSSKKSKSAKGKKSASGRKTKGKK